MSFTYLRKTDDVVQWAKSLVFKLNQDEAANARALDAKANADSPALSGIGNYADDAAAASGGVPVGGVYRNGSVLMVRVS